LQQSNLAGVELDLDVAARLYILEDSGAFLSFDSLGHSPCCVAFKTLLSRCALPIEFPSSLNYFIYCQLFQVLAGFASPYAV
jgi:hypothetical protein